MIYVSFLLTSDQLELVTWLHPTTGLGSSQCSEERSRNVCHTALKTPTVEGCIPAAQAPGSAGSQSSGRKTQPTRGPLRPGMSHLRGSQGWWPLGALLLLGHVSPIGVLYDTAPPKGSCHSCLTLPHSSGSGMSGI